MKNVENTGRFPGLSRKRPGHFLLGLNPFFAEDAHLGVALLRVGAHALQAADDDPLARLDALRTTRCGPCCAPSSIRR